MTSFSTRHLHTRRSGAALAVLALVAGGLSALTAPPAAAAALPGPAVVGPTETDTVRKQVVLDWAGTSGASSYVVQLGTDSGWSGDPTLQLSTVATRVTLPVSLPHASYWWRVAAVGPAGQGRWSANGSFTRGWPVRPLTAAPAQDEQVPAAAGRPTFSWRPMAGASEYQLQVSTSPYFNNAVQSTASDKTEACFTTRTTVTPFTGQANARNDGAGACTFSLLGTGEPRYWRVRPLDHVVDGAPEVDTTPIVDEGISSQPPAPKEELDTTACSAEGAPECEPAHTVEKGRWSLPVRFSSIAPTEAVDNDNRFTRLDPAPLNAPALAADVPGLCRDGVCRDFPTVSWSPVPGATRYRVYVALDRYYQNIQAIIETSALRWTPTDQWRERDAGAAYYVVVQPCTTTGTTAGCGQVGTPSVFRKTSPALVAASPADGARLRGGEQVLSWRAASAVLSDEIGAPATSEAYAYRVQVTRSSNPDFLPSGLVDDALVDSTHHVSATQTYPDGSYLWRVQAVDASGHKQPWSATRRFTRDATAPTFTVSPTSRLAVSGRVTVAFSEPVNGVSASTVTMGGVRPTVTPSADRRRATLTPDRRLVPGAVHPVTVSSAVTDLSGNPVSRRTVAVGVDPLADDRSPAIGLSGTWTRLTSSNAVRGTFSRSVPTTAARTAATVSLVGRGYEVKGCVGPANGFVEVWADGVRVARIDTYRSYSGCGVVLKRSSFASGAGTHRLQLRGIGVKRASSRGTAVGLDAVTAIR